MKQQNQSNRFIKKLQTLEMYNLLKEKHLNNNCWCMLSEIRTGRNKKCISINCLRVSGQDLKVNLLLPKQTQKLTAHLESNYLGAKVENKKFKKKKRF